MAEPTSLLSLVMGVSSGYSVRMFLCGGSAAQTQGSRGTRCTTL